MKFLDQIKIQHIITGLSRIVNLFCPSKGKRIPFRIDLEFAICMLIYKARGKHVPPPKPAVALLQNMVFAQINHIEVRPGTPNYNFPEFAKEH